MAIETMEDWNNRLAACGCCAMPIVDFIQFRMESIIFYSAVAGVSDGSDWYLQQRNDYAEGGFIQLNYSPTFAAFGGGVIVQAITRTDTEGDPQTGAITKTYSSPNPLPAMREAARSAIAAAVDWDVMTRDLFPGSLLIDQYGRDNLGTHTVFRHARYRFGNSSIYNPDGQYLKITYDVLESPFVGDAFIYAPDLVLEWEGPGTGGVEDDSWFTPWQDLPPPTAPGIRSIVNIRYTHYRSNRYGIKPQTQGPSFPAP